MYIHSSLPDIHYVGSLYKMALQGQNWMYSNNVSRDNCFWLNLQKLCDRKLKLPVRTEFLNRGLVDVFAKAM